MNDRPVNLTLKKKNLYETTGDNIDILIGKKHSDLLTDMEQMWLTSAKDRINMCWDIAWDQGFKYYRVLSKILSMQIEDQDMACYFTDYIKSIIESATKFTESHLSSILATF